MARRRRSLVLPAVGIIVLLMLTGALLFAATGSNEQTVVLPVGLPVGQLQTHQQDGAVEERLRPAVTAISAQATPAMSRDDYLKLRADLADIHQQLGDIYELQQRTPAPTPPPTPPPTARPTPAPTSPPTPPATVALLKKDSSDGDDLFAFTPTDIAHFSDGVNSDKLFEYAHYVRRNGAVFGNALAVVMQTRKDVIERRYAPAGAKDKLLLVSACTGKAAIEAYCDLHVEAMDMYAAKHKLDFIQIRGDLDPERLNPWIKVIVIRLLLEKNPRVMWVDADVMFRDMNWNVSAFVDTYFKEGVEILTAHDMIDIHSSGFLVIRSTLKTRSWLERWYMTGWMYNGSMSVRAATDPGVLHMRSQHPTWTLEFMGHRCHLDLHFYEQGCLEFLYADFPAYKGIAKVLDHYSLASIVYRDKSTKYCKSGPPMLHVCCRPMHIRRLHLQWCLEDLRANGTCWWRDVRIPGDAGAPPAHTTLGVKAMPPRGLPPAAAAAAAAANAVPVPAPPPLNAPAPVAQLPVGVAGKAPSQPHEAAAAKPVAAPGAASVPVPGAQLPVAVPGRAPSPPHDPAEAKNVPLAPPAQPQPPAPAVRQALPAPPPP